MAEDSAAKDVREFCVTHRMTDIRAANLARFAKTIVRAQRALLDGRVRAGAKTQGRPTFALCGRLVEQTLDLAAAAVCIANAELFPATEAACRPAIELGVNAMYILAEDDACLPRLVQYMFSYVDEADRRVNEWSKDAPNEDASVRTVNDAARHQRREASRLVREFLERVRVEANVEAADAWPGKIRTRFKACGLGSTYNTVYGALSAQAHGGAEDLVHEFIARTSGGDIWKKQQAENRAFAVSMLWFAIDLSLQVAHRYLGSHDLDAAARAIDGLRKQHGNDAPRWVPGAVRTDPSSPSD